VAVRISSDILSSQYFCFYYSIYKFAVILILLILLSTISIVPNISHLWL